MKREYDKLQRRYLKHNRDKHRDSEDESEAKQLSLKLEVSSLLIICYLKHNQDMHLSSVVESLTKKMYVE